MAGLLLTIGSVAAYFLPPAVDTTSIVFPDNPFSLLFEIKNENILPLVSVDYSCVLQAAQIGGWQFKEGDITGNGPQSPPMHYDVLWGRNATSGRCEYGVNVPPGVPVKEARYRLTIHYWSIPVPIKRTRSVDFVAIRDPEGRIYKWTPE